MNDGNVITDWTRMAFNDILNLGNMAIVRRVPGGWCYETMSEDGNSIAVCFIPLVVPGKGVKI